LEDIQFEEAKAHEDCGATGNLIIADDIYRVMRFRIGESNVIFTCNLKLIIIIVNSLRV
jgi:protein tyrosine phosphatase